MGNPIPVPLSSVVKQERDKDTADGQEYRNPRFGELQLEVQPGHGFTSY